MGRVRKLFLNCLFLAIGLLFGVPRMALAQPSQNGRVVQQGDGGADGHTTLEIEPPPGTASALQMPGDREEYSLITGEAFRRALEGAPADARQFDRCVERFHAQFPRPAQATEREMQDRRIQCACAAPEGERFQQSLCVLVNAPAVPGFGTRISAAAAITQQMTAATRASSALSMAEQRGDEHMSSLREMSANYSAQILDLQRQLAGVQNNQAEVERLTGEVARLQAQLAAAPAAGATPPVRTHAARPARRALRASASRPRPASAQASVAPATPSSVTTRRSFSARTASDPLFHVEETVRCGGIRMRGTDRFRRCMAGVDASIVSAFRHVPTASLSPSSVPADVGLHARYTRLPARAQQALVTILSTPANSGLIGLKCASHGRYFRQRIGTSSVNRDRATPVTLANFRSIAPAGCGPTEISLPDHQVFFIPMVAPAATLVPANVVTPTQAPTQPASPDLPPAPSGSANPSAAPSAAASAQPTVAPTALPTARSVVEADPALRAQIQQQDDPDTSKNIVICVLIALIVVFLLIGVWRETTRQKSITDEAQKQAQQLFQATGGPSENKSTDIVLYDDSSKNMPPTRTQGWGKDLLDESKPADAGKTETSGTPVVPAVTPVVPPTVVNPTTTTLPMHPKAVLPSVPEPGRTKKTDSSPPKKEEKDAGTTQVHGSASPEKNIVN